MVIIRLASGQEWCASNWVYRRLRADLASSCGERPDLLLEFEKGEAFGMLDHTYLPPGVQVDVWAALRDATDRVWTAPASDAADERAYRDAIRGLRVLLETSEGTDG